MEHLSVPAFLGMLVVILSSAKIMGALAQRLGQPAVLGELLAGVLVGKSALGLVDPAREAVELLSELGVVILLFAIGLETDLGKLFKVGATSLTVAVAGVVLPFAAGYAACLALGLASLPAIMAAATLTATSVGITARVLADLGRLGSEEGRIILGAAVLDDILGLVILTIVTELALGREVSLGSVGMSTFLAVAFLVGALAVGRYVVPWIFRAAQRLNLPGTPTALALIVALALAWLADRSGSAMILGAFAAGILVAKVPAAREIEHGITEIGHFLVPLFFVVVGASVDLDALDPRSPDSRFALLAGGVLIVVGVAGKLAAGYAPFWFKGSKLVIGVGMTPRGEVGLIFAKMGLTAGVLSAGLFGGVMLMVIATTLIAPPVLKRLLGPAPLGEPEPVVEGLDDLVTEA